MSFRTWLTLPTLGLIATGCPSDDPATTAEESSSTGGDEEDESETTDEPTTSTTDDPTTDPDSSSSTTDDPATTDPDSSSSTGPEVACGNGDVDDGEECDDENTVDGDTCTATCTLPVETVWQVSYNASASNLDRFSDAVVDGDGNIYVVGRERVTDEGFNLLLRQYLPDGSDGWAFSYDGAFNGDDDGLALVLLDDGDFVVHGTVETELTGENLFAARIDGTTQEVEWEIIQDGPGMGPGDNDELEFPGDIAVDGDGNIYMTGSVRVGAQDWDVFTARYDGAGVEVWQDTYAGAFGGGDISRGVVVDAEGVTWVAGSEETEDGVEGLVLAYDVDGVRLDDEQQTIDFAAQAIELDPDGNFVISGSAELGDTFVDIIVREYDATWTEAWTTTIDHDGSDDFAGSSLSVDAAGNVYVGGTTRVNAAAFDAYVRVLDTDGMPMWGAVYGPEIAEGKFDDQYNIVLAHPDGDVIAAGFETIPGEQTNGLITKYHAL